MENKNKESQEKLVLSWKWYAKTLGIIIVILLVLLYGIYGPIMNHYSKKHVRNGDALRERLTDIKAHPDYYAAEARKWVSYSQEADSYITGYEKIFRSNIVQPYRQATKFITRQSVANVVDLADRLVKVSDKFFSTVDTTKDFKKSEFVRKEYSVLLEDYTSVKTALAAFHKVFDKMAETNIKPKRVRTGTGKIWTAGLSFKSKVDRFASLWDYDRCVDIIIDEYNMAIAYNRRNLDAHYKLGKLYTDMGQNEEGFREMTNVVKISPKSLLSKQVQDYLASRVKSDTQNLEALYYYAMTKLYTKHKDEGIKLFEKIKNIDAKSYMAFEAQMRLVELFPSQDFDNDGLSNGKELKLFTDPLNPDTDGDGVYDGADKDPLDPEVR